MCQSGRIKFLHPFQRLFKTAAVCAFISHRPNNHTGTVFISLYTFLNTVHNCRFPLWIICNRLIPMPEFILIAVILIEKFNWPMTFNICFINYHKTIFVTELIKNRSIRIMTCSNRIYIMALHKQ